jgi:AcrR family transcriptional regulator
MADTKTSTFKPYTGDMIAPPTLRERRRERRTLEILEAALEVFSLEGYANASMDRIAERALLTRVGLYKYFPDKQHLAVALREWKLEELANRIQVALEHQTSLEQQVRTIAEESIEFQNEHQGFFRVLFDASVPADLSLKPFLYTIATVLEEAMKNGEIQGDPLELAGLLATMVFEPSIKQHFVIVPKPYTAPKHLPALICQVFLNGILSPAKTSPPKRKTKT